MEGKKSIQIKLPSSMVADAQGNMSYTCRICMTHPLGACLCPNNEIDRFEVIVPSKLVEPEVPDVLQPDDLIKLLVEQIVTETKGNLTKCYEKGGSTEVIKDVGNILRFIQRM